MMQFDRYQGVQNGEVRDNFQNTFRKEFAKFENQVWNYSSLRPAEAFKIDRQLPSLLIESFAKLLQLWRDYDVLQEVIQVEQLQRIRDDLNQFVGQDISHFEVLCDTCDGQISVEGNDLQYSYSLHAQTARHREALNNFRDLISPSKNDVGASEERSASNRDTFNGYVVLASDNRLSCSLCNESLKDEVDAIQHVTSWQHQLHEMPYNCENRNYIVEIDGVLCCRLCRCQLPDSEESRSQHLRGRPHQLQEKCCEALRENEPFVVLLNRGECKFRCELCDTSSSGWLNLLRHCEMAEHRVRLRSMKTDSDRETKQIAGNSKHEEDFILCLNDRYECTLCQCELCVWEIAAHKREEAHVLKRREVMKETASSVRSDNSRSVNSDGECDYSEVLDNNFYIDLDLTAAEAEVFKCLLCAKTGMRLDNLESHCLTEQHRSLKRRIERVSKMVADADLTDEDLSIELVDDVYFCHLCDILFDNHGDMINHENSKKHRVMEQQRKVLRANGACITQLNDKDPKSYFCNLCDKEIEGGGNIVTHGKSNRHKVLLDIVQAVSKSC